MDREPIAVITIGIEIYDRGVEIRIEDRGTGSGKNTEARRPEGAYPGQEAVVSASDVVELAEAEGIVRPSMEITEAGGEPALRPDRTPLTDAEIELMTAPLEREWLTIGEAAERLGGRITAHGLSQAIFAGACTAEKVKGKWLVRLADAETYLANRKCKTAGRARRKRSVPPSPDLSHTGEESSAEELLNTAQVCTMFPGLRSEDVLRLIKGGDLPEMLDREERYVLPVSIIEEKTELLMAEAEKRTRRRRAA